MLSTPKDTGARRSDHRRDRGTRAGRGAGVRASALLAVGLALAAAFALFVPLERPPAPPPASARLDLDAPRSSSAPKAPRAPTGRRESLLFSAGARDDEAKAPAALVDEPPPPPSAVAVSAVELYRRASRYPPTSSPLRSHQDDLIHPNKRHERPRPSEESPSVEVLFTADRYAVTARAPLTVSLHAWRDDAPVAIELVESAMTVIAPAQGSLPARPLELKPEGAAFVGSVVLADHFPAEEALQVRLAVAFRIEGGGLERASLDVLFTSPKVVPARFAGVLHDAIGKEGSLEITVGVEVYRPGYYVIDANLWSVSGEPVAWTRWKGTLGAQSPPVTLAFFGKAIRDRGIPGPYRLGELRGVRVAEGHDPDLENMTGHASGHETRAYSLTDFSDAEWQGAARAQRLEALERATLDPGGLASEPRTPEAPSAETAP